MERNEYREEVSELPVARIAKVSEKKQIRRFLSSEEILLNELAREDNQEQKELLVDRYDSILNERAQKILHLIR